MLIATDLDGTFLAGSPAQQHRLTDCMSRNPQVRLTYVTRRNMPSTLNAHALGCNGLLQALQHFPFNGTPRSAP